MINPRLLLKPKQLIEDLLQVFEGGLNFARK
jgi:hypothetical protein